MLLTEVSSLFAKQSWTSDAEAWARGQCHFFTGAAGRRGKKLLRNPARVTLELARSIAVDFAEKREEEYRGLRRAYTEQESPGERLRPKRVHPFADGSLVTEMVGVFAAQRG